MSEALYTAVRQARALLGASPRVCVALSGGRDSVVLLHVLHTLSQELSLSLQACHIHHGLLPEAPAWAKFCEALCTRWHIPYRCTSVQVDHDSGLGLEQAARQARYHALNQIDCDILALAHHQDDQAETLLFRLARGAGVAGAGAMPALSVHCAPEKPRWRPLLNVPRKLITAYAHAHHLSWVEDPSNADPSYARNAIRLHLAPVLEAQFPAWAANFARAATHFDQAKVLLQDLAQIDFLACAGKWLPQSGIARWQREPFLKLSPIRARNMLYALCVEHGHYAPIQRRLEEGLRQLGLVDSLYFPLSEQHALAQHAGQVWLQHPFLPLSADTQHFKLEQANWAGLPLSVQSTTGQGIHAQSLCEAQVYWGKRQPGLRLQWRPRQVPQTFKKTCQHLDIPAWLRDVLPILYINKHPAWMPGVGVMHKFACPPGEAGFLLNWQAWPLEKLE